MINLPFSDDNSFNSEVIFLRAEDKFPNSPFLFSPILISRFPLAISLAMVVSLFIDFERERAMKKAMINPEIMIIIVLIKITLRVDIRVVVVGAALT